MARRSMAPSKDWVSEFQRCPADGGDGAAIMRADSGVGWLVALVMRRPTAFTPYPTSTSRRSRATGREVRRNRLDRQWQGRWRQALAHTFGLPGKYGGLKPTIGASHTRAEGTGIGRRRCAAKRRVVVLAAAPTAMSGAEVWRTCATHRSGSGSMEAQPPCLNQRRASHVDDPGSPMDGGYNVCSPGLPVRRIQHLLPLAA